MALGLQREVIMIALLGRRLVTRRCIFDPFDVEVFWGEMTANRKILKIPIETFYGTLIHVSWLNLVKIGGWEVDKMASRLRTKPHSARVV